jgi:hypothetical protein
VLADENKNDAVAVPVDCHNAKHATTREVRKTTPG